MDTKQNTKALILIFFIGIIGGGMGAVSILYMITWIQELLLVPDNYILFQFKDSYHYIITLYEMEFLILILMIMRKKDFEEGAN